MERQFETIERAKVNEIDEILGQPFYVLDDGFVRIIDYIGDDSSIVQAARVSYGKGTKKLRQDRGLIRYLMRHHHTTPFEMCEIKLHVRVPMDTWRQWIRHRTANVNEYSTRYSVAIDAAYQTNPDAWRTQGTDNRQGSEGVLQQNTGETLSRQEQTFQNQARTIYNERLEQGVAREQARKDLPLSTYTEAYWKIDLHNLLHFLRLRMDDHAQYEIRTYAKTIGEQIVRRWTPIAWEAFHDYRMTSAAFSKMELDLLKAITGGKDEQAIELAKSNGVLKEKEGQLKPNLELREFEAKLKSMQIKPPWS
ncbi:MAG: FAD-dependent thymidylate synthase [Caldithrix sp.]|nr:FAD-dependent thymidylate synthase [Caldithrix sp.]